MLKTNQSGVGLARGAERGENRRMTKAKSSATIELEYETFGDPKNPALLLVMGYTAQMVAWDEEFCKMFAAKIYS